MGSFSWTRAETTTARSNITEGDRYKILVPKEFGGGYILDTYEDYGHVFSYAKEGDICRYFDGDGIEHDGKDFDVADLYGILAYWNSCDNLVFVGAERPQTMQDILQRGATHNATNRYQGIEIGCYDDQIDALRYPLKLVSVSYRGAYEDCLGASYGDPNQGFYKGYWRDDDYETLRERLKLRENARNE